MMESLSVSPNTHYSNSHLELDDEILFFTSRNGSGNSRAGSEITGAERVVTFLSGTMSFNTRQRG